MSGQTRSFLSRERPRRAHHSGLALCVLVCALALLVGPKAIAAPAVTVDVATSRILSAEEPDRLWAPASLTKLMTAWITFKALRAGDIDMEAPVRISVAAANAPPSRTNYGVGSVMTVDNALKYLIIKSANDVAVALGEAIAGSEAAFVDIMNAEAQALGMSRTRFANPHGLDDPGQYSTARDLARLATAIRRDFPEHAGYFSAEAIRAGETVTPTYNILLGRFDGADGMKTGFVCASGFNLAASATRSGRTIIAIVLGAQSQKERAEIAARALEDGFLQTPENAPHTLASLPVDEGRAALPTADLRDQICTEEAQAARWDGRQVEGYITFDTPLITPLQREPLSITAGLGGATGRSNAAIMFNGTVISGFPVPDDKPTLLEPDDGQRFGLRPGFDLPVPTGRPQEG